MSKEKLLPIDGKNIKIWIKPDPSSINSQIIDKIKEELSFGYVSGDIKIYIEKVQYKIFWTIF